MRRQLLTFVSKSIKAGISALGAIALLLSGCQPSLSRIEPTITYVIPQHKLERLPSAFDPFTTNEKWQDWAKEIMIGDAFAREQDLYRAITAYKRALLLTPYDLKERRLQILYNITLCYYIGSKYQDVINTFEGSELTEAKPPFPPLNNLLIMLYDSYLNQDQSDKAAVILELIEACSPDTSRDLTLYTDVIQGDVCEVSTDADKHPVAEKLMPYVCEYVSAAKSPKTAKVLNAILPGAGYYYVGQKKSALTSFLINALFTAAAYQFFHHGYYAAGAITTSLELGWYMGGINGAGIEASEYNQRLYEAVGHKMMVENNLFPILMFETAF
jgi:hypothetical protein